MYNDFNNLAHSHDSMSDEMWGNVMVTIKKKDIPYPNHFSKVS